MRKLAGIVAALALMAAVPSISRACNPVIGGAFVSQQVVVQPAPVFVPQFAVTNAVFVPQVFVPTFASVRVARPFVGVGFHAGVGVGVGRTVVRQRTVIRGGW